MEDSIATGNVKDTEDGEVTKQEQTRDEGLTEQLLQKDQEIEDLKMQVLRVMEDLEREVREKRIIESNIRENISSVDEFEEDEKRMQQHHKEAIEKESLINELEQLKKESDRMKQILCEACGRGGNEASAQDEDIILKLQKLACERNEMEKSLQMNDALLGEIEGSKVALEKELAASTQQLTERENACEIYEKKAEQMKTRLVKMEEEKQLMLDEHQIVNGELNEKKQTIVELEDLLSRKNEELLEVSRLTEEISILHQERLSLEKQLEIQSKDVENYRQVIEDNKRNNAEMSDKICSLCRELEEIRQEKDNLQTEVLQTKAAAVESPPSENECALGFEPEEKKEEIMIQNTDDHDQAKLLLEELSLKLQIAVEENNAIKEKLKLMEGDGDNMKTLLDEEHNKVIQATETVNKMCQEKEELLSSLAASQTSVFELEKDIQSHQSSVCDLQNSLSSEKNKADMLLSQVDQVNAEKCTLSESLHEAVTVVRELQGQHTDNESSLKALTEELTAMATLCQEKEIKLQELEDAKIGFLEKISELKKEISSSHENSESMSSIVQELHLKITILEEEKKLLSEKMKSLDESLGEEQQNNSELSLKRDQLSVDVVALSSELQRAEEQVSVLEEEKAEVRSLLNANISQCEISKQNAENLEIEVNSLRREYLEVQQTGNDLHVMQSLVKETERLCDEKDSQITERERLVEEKNAELEKLDVELSEMKTSLAAQTLNTEAKEQRINSLEKDLQIAFHKNG